MATEKWSVEKAWQWHNSSPWLRGCNFLPSDCCNRIDFWQSLNWDKHIATADRELELAASAGLNSVRMILEFTVLDEEHDSFMERFERYISLCDKYGISCMVVLANDCMPPKSPEWKMPDIGEQHYDIGYHGGRKVSPHGAHGELSYHHLDDPAIKTGVRKKLTDFKDSAYQH